MRISLVGVCMLVVLASVVVPETQKASAALVDYQVAPDATGWAGRWWDGGGSTYYKGSGDLSLSLFTEGASGFEYRGYWRFSIPDFTDKDVKDVKLEFRTGNEACYESCRPPLLFWVDTFRLYVNPMTGTAQQVYDGIDEHQGLPYIQNPLDLLVIQKQSSYSPPLGPNAVADINHHEGGWYAVGMKLFQVKDQDDKSVGGGIALCGLPNCPNPPPQPWSRGSVRGSPASKPGPSPLYAIPVLTISYEPRTAWTQLHGDARHNGYTSSLAPNTGTGLWNPPVQECDATDCRHSGYSPVAKDGYVYTVINRASGGMTQVRAFDYGGNLAASSPDLPGTEVPAFHSLAVNNEMVVYTGADASLPDPRTFIYGLSLAPTLTQSWSYEIPWELNYAAPTLYGRYVLVGTTGTYDFAWGRLYLLEARASTVTPVWTFTPPPAGGDIFAPPAVYKDWVLVRTTTKLYAIPLVDPNDDGVIGNGVSRPSEIRWTFDLGAWPGDKWDRALNSGPAVKGGYVYIGSHMGSVYKLPIESSDPPAPVWTYNAGPAYFVPSTPGIGFGYVYVTLMAYSGTPVYVRRIRDQDGFSENPKRYDNANAGKSSPSLADGKVFLWMGSTGGTLPVGAWAVVLNEDLSSELYRVQTGPAMDGTDATAGNTPAIASSSRTQLDSWVFVGNGWNFPFIPPPDQWGYVRGWNV